MLRPCPDHNIHIVHAEHLWKQPICHIKLHQHYNILRGHIQVADLWLITMKKRLFEPLLQIR